MLKVRLFIITLFLVSGFVKAHTLPMGIRTLKAVKIAKSPKIDGKLNEGFWANIKPAGSFLQYEPYNGKHPSQRTEVKVGYDNEAIYIGAVMYDTKADSIMRAVGKRDNGEGDNADLFSVSINTFDEGMNVFRFMVSAAGVQTDGKYNGSWEDRNWDAVWISDVNITDIGWIAEIKIPFSALRFAKADVQDWKVNFHRHIRRYREWDTWNYADIKQNNLLMQNGVLKDIEDVEPPLRLALLPYVSTYADVVTDESWRGSFNGGMDIKYGISESFTLDMSLIPDFGQVQSDDRVLNLSPFEVRYSEKRPFFTEGTELFSRGDMFYSRRIGGKPKMFNDADDNLAPSEKVTKNEHEVKMLNATKISGRTKGGLGIGFLNAMTDNAYATITDTITGKERSFKTQGFTNYNMVVFDQSLPNQSYISFANTNYYRGYSDYLSDVAALVFQFKDKDLKYRLHGTANVSMIKNGDFEAGQRYRLQVGKVKGNLLYDYVFKLEDDKYNPNDMGFLQRNNVVANWGQVRYNIYQPFGVFRSFRSRLSMYYGRLYNPSKYTSFNMSFNVSTTLKRSHLSMGLNGWMNLKNSHDYFEPRVWGKMYVKPKEYNIGGYLSSDYRKTLAIDLSGKYAVGDMYSFNKYQYSISPRLRASDKLMFIHKFDFNQENNNVGYVAKNEVNDDYVVDFGKRDITTITNTFNANYTFNEDMFVGLRVRHYWRKAIYKDFYNLKEDGYVSESLGYMLYSNDKDQNFNAFNIDLTYSWYFAPGSQITLAWKNAISTSDKINETDFFRNFSNTLNAQQYNSFSVKVLYYLDYQNIKAVFKRKNS